MTELHNRGSLWHDLRLDTLVADAARGVPDRVAEIDHDRHVTYGELGHMVDSARRWLAVVDVGACDVVTCVHAVTADPCDRALRH